MRFAVLPSAAELMARTLEHRKGLHDQSTHGRWSAANRARASARELDELRQSIATAKRVAAERRPAPAPAPPVPPTATPTRMTKGQYTKLLKDEHIRLQMLDGKTEKEAPPGRQHRRPESPQH